MVRGTTIRGNILNWFLYCKYTKYFYNQMKPEDFLKNTLTDIKVKLTEEFDKNFERKAFFTENWKGTRLHNSRGSLMMRSGKLRKSITSKLTPQGVQFSSSLPYADIHNNGGEIIVTAKMKRFFWAMYYKASGAISKTKKGKISNSQRNKKLSAEALSWKALALKKVGSTMDIEQRRFIGHHPEVDTMIKEIIAHNLNELKIKPFDQ